MKKKVLILILQIDWLSGEFRDCNGESNGVAIPSNILAEEKFCDDLDSRTRRLAACKFYLFFASNIFYLTKSELFSVARGNGSEEIKIGIGNDQNIRIPSLVRKKPFTF